jgi:DMSO/TMAO reductase YedYZ molybdopterin-dependent catalytic subunit
MVWRKGTVGVLLAMLVMTALLLGCGSSTSSTGVMPSTTASSAPGTTSASTAPGSSTTTSASSVAVLELVAKDGTSVKLTMDDLKKLPVVEGYGGIKSSTGRITAPALFTGVAVSELAKQAGGLEEGAGVSLIAKDGYEMTMSAGQIMDGTFTTYDVSTGDEIRVDDKLTVIIAYAREGKPLDPESDGDLRLVIVTPKNTQVTDGHWSVKWLTKVQVKALGGEWTLHMEGAIADDVDRGTFESCAAANCHGVSWKDEKAQEWTGVPLYLLAGRVDDTNKHGTGAFSRDVAAKGYKVEVENGDGSKTTLDAASIIDKKDILVAYQVNGNPLGDWDFPLRLVGNGLKESEMVGKIATIRLVLP